MINTKNSKENDNIFELMGSLLSFPLSQSTLIVRECHRLHFTKFVAHIQLRPLPTAPTELPTTSFPNPNHVQMMIFPNAKYETSSPPRKTSIGYRLPMPIILILARSVACAELCSLVDASLIRLECVRIEMVIVKYGYKRTAHGDCRRRRCLLR